MPRKWACTIGCHGARRHVTGDLTQWLLVSKQDSMPRTGQLSTGQLSPHTGSTNTCMAGMVWVDGASGAASAECALQSRWGTVTDLAAHQHPGVQAVWTCRWFAVTAALLLMLGVLWRICVTASIRLARLLHSAVESCLCRRWRRVCLHIISCSCCGTITVYSCSLDWCCCGACGVRRRLLIGCAGISPMNAIC